jgi:ribosomal protein RSM22 (predicted rRNA methylase)
LSWTVSGFKNKPNCLIIDAMIPDSFSEKIDNLLHNVPLGELSRAAESIMKLYREKGQKRPLATRAEHLAYIAYRMPATFGVLSDIFSRIRMIDSTFSPRSLLDLGAGPGTATLACETFFGPLDAATLIEQDRLFCSLGKELHPARPCQWIERAIDEAPLEPFYDLVVASYVLGEMTPAARNRAAARAWAAAHKYLVVVEPGTPEGYRTIMSVRDQLLGDGAHLLAPCPHSLPCPLVGSDWCHFSTRVARSHMHRLIKGAALGWEDEKFSYVLFSRQARTFPGARIIRAPRKHSGFIEFTLCCPDGVAREKSITRKMGNEFKLAKKAEWGDILATQ